MRKIVAQILLLLVPLVAAGQNIGIGVTAPSDKLHINAATGEDALRVQVNSLTKLRVWSNGGVSIGSPVTPPVNGLYVNGSIQPQSGMETAAKMIIESTADSIVLKAGGSVVIIAANGNITIRSGGSSTLNIEAGGSLAISAGAQLNLSAGAGININTSSIISVMGTQIRLNGSARPVARVSDTVNGTQILTGNPTVVTN